jgi:hypothetical protein
VNDCLKREKLDDVNVEDGVGENYTRRFHTCALRLT